MDDYVAEELVAMIEKKNRMAKFRNQSSKAILENQQTLIGGLIKERQNLELEARRLNDFRIQTEKKVKKVIKSGILMLTGDFE